MPTTRDGCTFNISSSGSSTSSLPTPPASSSHSDLPITAQPGSLTPTTVWESTAESPKGSETLPPRMRLKEKRKLFGEFRIIREPAELQDRMTELKPIPSPPWANDSFSLDSSRLRDSTRGKGTSHARSSFSSSPPFRHKESRSDSKSSVECSITGGLHTAHQIDNGSSDAGPLPGIAYRLRPHQAVKPRVQTISMHAEEEQSVPDEDEDDIIMASAVLKELQHSGTEVNTFPPPARPSKKQKRYACDVCGQIFTRSGDVRRHKESRHDNSEGCRCPFCDRVLTRQDALQRHWDKYCRKKSKRHLDKQAAETQTRTTPSMPIPVYTPGVPPTQTTSIATTMGIGTTLDQSQINYRYLNIFG